jgi:flagellar motor switch protein FliN
MPEDSGPNTAELGSLAQAVSDPSAAGTRPLVSELLLDLEVPVSISFGRARLLLKDVLELSLNSLVELDRSPEEPVEVLVNDRVIARGEVVAVSGKYGVRILDIVSPREWFEAPQWARGISGTAVEMARGAAT